MVQALCCGSPAFPFAKAVKAVFQFRKLLFHLSHCISKKGSNVSSRFSCCFSGFGKREWWGRKMFCAVLKDRLDVQQFHQQSFELILQLNYKSFVVTAPIWDKNISFMWNPTKLNTNVLNLLNIFLFACEHIVGFNTQGQGKKAIQKFLPPKWKASLNKFL